MTDRAPIAKPMQARLDRTRTPDERPMRVLELGLAGLAIAASILLTVIR